jgi:hypothetical protein
MVAEWCGASNGGRVSSGASDARVPAMEWIAVTSSAACSSSGGRRPGRRSASIVLPAPGGPARNRWCPPAAATSTARRPTACPTTSPRSATGAGSATAPRTCAGSTVRPERCATSCSSAPTASTSMPATSAASSALAAGTITCACPARAAASTDGSTPRIGRTAPSSPSSPSSTSRAIDAPGTVPAAASTAAASARSKPLPCLGMDAGDSPMVIRRLGNSPPAFTTAARTRSTDWRTTASGSPTSATPGRPCAMSSSTSTIAPRTPTRPTDQVRASVTRTPPAGA